MDTLEPSLARAARRATGWLAASLFGLWTGACAGLEPGDEPGGDVERLAERLVQSARERADLRPMRVWVAEIRETRQETARVSVRESSGDVLGLRLEHELVIALAARLNVIESEVGEAELTAGAGAALGERAAARGATHVLIGDYVRQRDRLQLTVRLIDADSRLIVAAARGEVRLGEVSLTGIDRLARDADDPELTAFAAVARPGTVVVQPSPTQRVEMAASPGAPAAGAQEAVGPSAAPVAPLRQPPAVIPGSGARGEPVEDFETWRKRRQAERAATAGQISAALDLDARKRTDAMVRARRDELSTLAEEAADPFPWRRYPWLAQLLGIPVERSLATGRR
jgi:hypothetical protein